MKISQLVNGKAAGISDCSCHLIYCISSAAEFFPDRTEVQCLHRWQKVLNPELVKGPWTQEVLFLFNVLNTFSLLVSQ